MKWHDETDSEMSNRPPARGDALFILQRLLGKLQDVEQDQAVALRCQQAGWVTTDKKWILQKWCKETRMLVQDKNMPHWKVQSSADLHHNTLTPETLKL